MDVEKILSGMSDEDREKVSNDEAREMLKDELIKSIEDDQNIQAIMSHLYKSAPQEDMNKFSAKIAEFMVSQKDGNNTPMMIMSCISILSNVLVMNLKDQHSIDLYLKAINRIFDQSIPNLKVQIDEVRSNGKF